VYVLASESYVSNEFKKIKRRLAEGCGKQGSVSRFAQSSKNTYDGRNNPWALSLTLKRRAKPPSPSPSITRRRTPAGLAVGVHSFEGAAANRFPRNHSVARLSSQGHKLGQVSADPLRIT